MRPAIVAGLMIPLVAAACGSSAGTSFNASALASGAVVQELGAGKVDSLPTGFLYVRVIHFAQPAGDLLQSTQHVPGFVYVETGTHRLSLAGQAPIDLQAGTAIFHQSVTHSHFNPGPGPSVWYFLAVWSNTARSAALISPIAHPEFESSDLEPGTFTPGPDSEVLRRVTLQSSGRTEAHRFGGVAVIFVLEGTLEIRHANGAPITLSAEQGQQFAPQVGLQEINPVSAPVVFLEFLTTPAGREFEVPLAQPPA